MYIPGLLDALDNYHLLPTPLRLCRDSVYLHSQQRPNKMDKLKFQRWRKTLDDEEWKERRMKEKIGRTIWGRNQLEGWRIFLPLNLIPLHLIDGTSRDWGLSSFNRGSQSMLLTLLLLMEFLKIEYCLRSPFLNGSDWQAIPIGLSVVIF